MPATSSDGSKFWADNAGRSAMSKLGYNAWQDCYGTETHPSYDPVKKFDPFDASIEEILHFLTNGYTNANPTVFGTDYTKPSKLTAAMDVARGGKFKTIPKKYPTTAWYSYTDKTCNYKCMAVEYLYWALTSHLGGQEGRAASQAHEWKLGKKAAFAKGDKLMNALLKDPANKMPTKLPNGKYTAKKMMDPCTYHK